MTTSQSITVLHVDDEPEFADLVSEFLERENDRFVVETATSASEAENRLDDRDFDCVVSDYDMPGRDGIQFLEAVREDETELPFILFTGKGSEEVASDAISSGVTDYIQKGGGTSQFVVLANRIENAVEHTRAEQRVEATEHKYRRLIEETSDVIVIVDSEGICEFVSPAAEEVLGYAPHELVGESPFQFIHQDDREEARSEFFAMVSDPTYRPSVEFRFETPDGSLVWIEARGRNLLDDPVIDGLVVYTRDISDRKEREQTLQTERDRRDALFGNTPDPIIEVRFEDNTAFIDGVNPAFEEVFGIDAEKATGQTVGDVVVPDSEHEEFARLRERVLRGKQVETEVKRETATGVREFLIRVIPFDVSDVSDGAYAWYTDITERKERERELERNEQIIQEMNDGVVVVQDGIITYTNPQVSEMADYSTEELRNTPMSEFIAPEDRELVHRRYQERVAGNDPPSTYEIRVLSKHGDTIPVEITASRVEYAGEPATVSIVRDIADRKQRERELERQNERLDEFASVISHDLRNPLNVAELQLELAHEECDSEHLDAVERSHDRMQRLIDDLLTLAREGATSAEVTAADLVDVAERAWQNVQTDEATLVTETEQTIQADRGRLGQLLENLFRNAIEHALDEPSVADAPEDAVEHGGTAVTVTVGGLDDGFYVEDDGSGIDPADRDQVFESGYSTSQDGTGFGLSIVEEIVDAHDWTVSITEGADGGARFEIDDVSIVTE
jgi:PAS domain S-box-containing protein